jgi:hypothetical protein
MLIRCARTEMMAARLPGVYKGQIMALSLPSYWPNLVECPILQLLGVWRLREV